MILLLSGEGPTDMGKRYGSEYTAGPMAVVTNQLVQSYQGYELNYLQNDGLCHFVSEHDLEDLEEKAPRLPGKKKNKHLYFMRNAEVLGLKAKEIEEESGDAVVTVLFRDCDGTRSDKAGLWQEKVDSMELGFERVGYKHGVPMVPKPKSEAWIICALKENPYQHCVVLESRSGNDKSPNNLKDELTEICFGNDSASDILEKIEDGSNDCFQIDMPSFNQFKSRLERVVQSVHRG